MTVAVQDILANDNLDSHGEKRKMPLEDGQEDPVTQPSKKMKLQKMLDNHINSHPETELKATLESSGLID